MPRNMNGNEKLNIVNKGVKPPKTTVIPIKKKEPPKRYKPKVKVNALKRLVRFLSLQAESYNYKQQSDIFFEFLRMYEAVTGDTKSLVMDTDEKGNFYITKGDPIGKYYPCAVAHLDQVHKYKEGMYEIHRDRDVLYAVTRNHNGSYKVAGTGGDDLVGVWLCLELLIKQDSCKIVLFIDEEVGCIGSGASDIEFFSDCTFILQGDRRGDTVDYVNHTNGISVTTPEYEEALKPIMNKYGYNFNTGSATDVGKLLNKGAGCVAGNISCGYYFAHRETEVVSISEAFTALEFMTDIFNKLSYDRWEYKLKKKTYPDYSGGYGMYGGWGGYDKDVKKYSEKREKSFAEKEYEELKAYLKAEDTNSKHKHTTKKPNLSIVCKSDDKECSNCGTPTLEREEGFVYCTRCNEWEMELVKK